MQTAIFCYTRKGTQLAVQIRERDQGQVLQSLSIYTMARFVQPGCTPYPEDKQALYRHAFETCDTLLFISACGIAVRILAPLLRDKFTDPAVLVLDDGGKFVISLLSGHVGGANARALYVADLISATPVISTATDGAQRFSVDSFAQTHGLALGDRALCKAVSAQILDGPVPIVAERPLPLQLPAGLWAYRQGEAKPPSLGIQIGVHTRGVFERTLFLYPRVLRVGIGCRKGISAEAIEAAVAQVWQAQQLARMAISCVCTIDRKADEIGLVSWCQAQALPLYTYTAEQLMRVPGVFTHSDFVWETTGADNVCERAACASGGACIVRKTSVGPVTVAVAEETWEVDFGDTVCSGTGTGGRGVSDAAGTGGVGALCGHCGLPGVSGAGASELSGEDLSV